jgi:hypothetical protein
MPTNQMMIYKPTSPLKILQFNMHASLKVADPFFADESIKDIDIMAIQEPYINANGDTSCPSWGGFDLAWPAQANPRVCFYINKRLDLNSWRHVFDSCDAGTLYIKIAPEDDFGEVAIHNIYNPSQGYGDDAAGTLPMLENMIIAGAEQVVLGDFNLHHPRWNCSNRITRHLAADRLNTITDEAGLTQCVPSETITYRHPNAVSKVDLCFLSPGLFSRLLSCEAQEELAHGSDHTPILTTIDCTSQAAKIHQRRNWKKADFTAVKEYVEKNLVNPDTAHNRNAIDAQVQRMEDTLQEAVNRYVPWARPCCHGRLYHHISTPRREL